MQTLALSISGMTCGHCVRSVREALEAVPGATVQTVRVGFAEVALDAATDPAALISAVRDAGYEATPATASRSAGASGHSREASR